MDLQDTGCRARFLIRDRDGKYPALFDTILADVGIEVVLSGVQMPRMNSLIERWVQSCRHELLDRALRPNSEPQPNSARWHRAIRHRRTGNARHGIAESYLAAGGSDSALAAPEYLLRCEEAGDFTDLLYREPIFRATWYMP